MKTKRLFVVPLATCALVLAGCSSDAADADSDATTTTTTAQTSGVDPSASDRPTCPSDPPADGVPAQWEVSGTTGSVSVVGQTDSTAPRITVDAPFSVDKTQVETLDKGDGPVVADDSVVTVCYVGVDGRDGSTFDSAYRRGTPAAFPANGVVPGFRQALVGQTVGSSVAVVMPPEDGYPNGTPDGSIQAGDTIVFALKILGIK